MSKHLLDTAILIDYFRGKDNAHDWLADFSGADLSISVVTAAELLEGCFNRKEQESVMNKLATYRMLDLSGKISQTAWEWYRQYHLSHGVGFLDCLIGATAYHHGLTVATLNEKHFRPFPNLQVVRPY